MERRLLMDDERYARGYAGFPAALNGLFAAKEIFSHEAAG
jgi:hypothetical protein